MTTRGIFLGDAGEMQKVWGPGQRSALRLHVDVEDRVWTADDLERAGEARRGVEVVFSTWGMPLLSARALEALPDLKAVFYAAGSVRSFAAPLWERGITVVSAWQANAVPVAEFTLAHIILALKQYWPHVRVLREEGNAGGWRPLPMPGVYGATVGLVSLGVIGRRVVDALRGFDVQCVAYDPFFNREEARSLGVELRSLEDVFFTADVVSIHTPWLKETEGLITGRLVESMKPGATLINTSRGAVVAEAEMAAVLQRRPDLTAVLDVTHPEPPEEGSLLYSLPNVLLTPHIAGSVGLEVQRMADWMVEECAAWREGRPLRFAVTEEMASRMA
jgi:phosphoglycerate dehydrogenase-like enzyme